MNWLVDLCAVAFVVENAFLLGMMAVIILDKEDGLR